MIYDQDAPLLHRVPEPELMEDPEQARAYADADFSESNELFIEHFTALFGDLGKAEVVDLGCGPADIAIRYAHRFPAVNFLAIDGSAAMLDLAQRRLAAEQLTQRIKLLCMSLGYNMPAELKFRFAAVMSNSLLHHLHDPGVLWHCVKELAEPGGAILIMDLVRPASRRQANDLVDTYAVGAPEVLRRDFFNSLLASFSENEVRDQLMEHGLGQLRVQRVSDRHMVIHGRMPV